MTALIVEFFLCSAVVIVAGTFLARFADRLGEMTGIGRSMAGVVLLALATSLPELLVGCKAVAVGAVDLGLGDLIGSSLFNLLILAILDLSTQTRGGMLSKSAASHALSAICSILLTSIVLLFLLLEAPWTFLNLGLGSWMVFVAYLFCLRLIFFDHQTSTAGRAEEEHPAAQNWKFVTAGYVLSAAVIFIAAPRLATVSDELAEATGLGGTIFGTTFVALITSLPEAVTTFTALRMGAVDMAVGNIFGSNAFNMVLLVGLDFVHEGSLLEAASATHAVTAVMVILVTTVVIQGLLYRAEKRFWIVEPDAVLVILLVVAALAIVYRIGHS